MPEDITRFFLNQGILGVIILVLAGVIIWMQRRIDKKDAEIRVLNEALAAIQDKRVTETGTYADKFINTSRDLLDGNKDLLGQVNTLIQLVQMKKNL